MGLITMMIVSTQSCLQRQPAVNDDPAAPGDLYPIPHRKRLPTTHQGLTAQQRDLRVYAETVHLHLTFVDSR